MPKILCTVPEQRTTKAQILASEALFKSVYAEHFGSEDGLAVLWVLAPAGQTFQAGKSADIFLTMIEVEDDLPQARREPAMWAFTRGWADILDVDVERLMVTCADSATVAEYVRGNRNRLRPISRIRFMLKTIVYVLQSRRRSGFAALRANP